MRNIRNFLLILGLLVICLFLTNTPQGHTQVAETIEIEQEIKNLEVDLPIGNLVIETADTDIVYVEIPEIPENLDDRIDINVNIEGDTLKVTGKEKNWLINGHFNIGNQEITDPVRIVFPNVSSLNDIDIETSLGDAELKQLNADQVTIDLNMGTLILDSIKINQANLNASMGNCDL